MSAEPGVYMIQLGVCHHHHSSITPWTLFFANERQKAILNISFHHIVCPSFIHLFLLNMDHLRHAWERMKCLFCLYSHVDLEYKKYIGGSNDDFPWIIICCNTFCWNIIHVMWQTQGDRMVKTTHRENTWCVPSITSIEWKVNEEYGQLYAFDFR